MAVNWISDIHIISVVKKLSDLELNYFDGDKYRPIMGNEQALCSMLRNFNRRAWNCRYVNDPRSDEIVYDPEKAVELSILGLIKACQTIKSNSGATGYIFREGLVMGLTGNEYFVPKRNLSEFIDNACYWLDGYDHEKFFLGTDEKK